MNVGGEEGRAEGLALGAAVEGVSVGVVVGTHLWLISASLPDAVKNQHAFINLAAAGLIVYSIL